MWRELPHETRSDTSTHRKVREVNVFPEKVVAWGPLDRNGGGRNDREAEKEIEMFL